MSSRTGYPAPTREHHDTFCTIEEWALVRGATGQPVKHHRTYELTLWDSRILRTRISQPVDRSTYGKSMWSTILTQQLCVSREEFWDCVQDNVKPDRGAPAPPAERPALPMHLAVALSEYNVDTATLSGLSAADAQSMLTKLIEQAGR